jgi:tetratricopeptide (TPR) repeat protein
MDVSEKRLNGNDRAPGKNLAAKHFLRWRIYKSALYLAVGFSLAAALTSPAFAQAKFLLYGDVKVDDCNSAGGAPMIMDVILYTKGMEVVQRQRINPGGRYRFDRVQDGDYWLVIEFDGAEVARDSVFIGKTSIATDLKHDLNLGCRSAIARKGSGGAVVSAADMYDRSEANKLLYQKSAKEIESKNYPQAIATLRELVSSDPGDFPAWANLGMLYFLQKDLEAAENSYKSALSAKSSYFTALLSLGRVRLARKNYEGAIEPLEAALKVDPNSASANYFLGEAYLQMKKGSKAVGYLNEALMLDPIGMADAHLRLAALYNGAGMKDRAAAEYEHFLQKKPDYPDRKALEKYIADNKKP